MTLYEDRTLVCAQCQSEFVFTAGEQEFFAEKGLASEPKRCKNCRDARKRKKPRKDDGIYRSPAFESSAPAHQKIRGRAGRDHRPRNPDYRSPGLNERSPRKDEYRSPAFRDIDVLKPEQEYRAPGFHEYDSIDPKEEYRAPGFSELNDINIREEYRAPGFQDMSKKYRDEKPLFAVTCASCGQDAMIPFLPEEGEPVYCKSCYAAEKARRRAEAAAPEVPQLLGDDAPADAAEATVSDDESIVPK